MTMKCEEFRDLLDDYVDDALTKEIKAEMDEHAKGCAECSNELRSAMLLKSMFADTLDAVELPEEARPLLYERIKAEKTKSKRNMYLKFFSAAAAALVLFIGISAIFKPNDEGKKLSSIDHVAEYDFVARDGVYEEEEMPVTAGSVEKTLVRLISSDSTTAMSAVETLASQYEGSATVSEEDATITAFIPSGSVDEFIEDMSAAGEVEADEIAETEEETVELEIVIEQE